MAKHSVSTLKVNGGIDGFIRCECGWDKYAVYPGAGWGRRSTGIRRPKGQTKGQYINNRLVTLWAKHASA